MSQLKKLLARFQQKPTDFRWDELQKLLAGLGYELEAGGKTGGSRRRFVHPAAAPIFLHQPHPRPVLKAYQVRQILDHLHQEGLL